MAAERITMFCKHLIVGFAALLARTVTVLVRKDPSVTYLVATNAMVAPKRRPR